MKRFLEEFKSAISELAEAGVFLLFPSLDKEDD